jgi:uncharacterized RDD family membrane protein YckC
MNRMNAIDTDIRGYLSQEHKRKFTITAGILGAVFFIVQFIVPFVVMMAAMPFMVFSLKMAEPQRGAYWNNAIWYIEKAVGTGTASDNPTMLKKIKPSSKDGPEDICELSIENPWLLAGENRLWIIASSAVGYYQDDDLVFVSKAIRLGDISRPFLYEALPAVVETKPTGFSLMVFKEGQWQKRRSIDLETEKAPTDIQRNLQVLSKQGKLHFFLRHGDTLHYRTEPTDRTQEGQASWQTVSQLGHSWQAIWIDAEPAVFLSRSGDFKEKIVGLRLSDNHWKPFFTHDALIADEMGVYPMPEPGKFAMLVQSFPGSVRLFVVDGSEIISKSRYGGGFPLPAGFTLVMFIPHILMLCLPLILAVILSGMMRKHRKCQHTVGSLSMPFASLARRATAQIIDFAFVIGPVLLGYLLLMLSFFDMEEMFISKPFLPLAGFGLMIGGFFWVLACLLLFSFFEGKWGGTPGKWILGIRVFGTDLQPCGFGRALVRNLLKFVDGFFNFMVGVMVVALSESWQRVGDMAARTVVINIRKRNREVPPDYFPQGQR